MQGNSSGKMAFPPRSQRRERLDSRPTIDDLINPIVRRQEFLAFPRPDVPSCFVLDVQLPGLSGLDLQEELAKVDVQIPIIFLTGHGDIPMTRAAPKDWPRLPGRIDATLIAHTAWPSTLFPTCYVCGPTSFVESATGFLTASGNDPDKIRTERFGPTGDRQ